MIRKKAELRRTLIGLSIFLSLFNGALVVLVITLYYESHAFAGTAVLIFLLIILGLSVADFIRMLQDLRLTCKTVQTRVARKWTKKSRGQYGTNLLYFIKVDAIHRDLAVSWDQYFSVNVGDMVRLEYHPKSKIIEEFTPIKG